MAEMGKRMPPSDEEKGSEKVSEKGNDHKSRKPQPPPHIYPPPEKPWFPGLVPAIFLVNLALFIYTMYLNDCPNGQNPDDCILPFLKRFSFQPFKENPLLGPSMVTLQKLGALEFNLIVDNGEWWRLLSCMWLHAGVFHLLVNMISLIFIGIRFEQEFGFVRIGLLYVLAGVAGALASLNHQRKASQPNLSVGASGALFGLLGAMLSELLTNWTIYTNKCIVLLILVVVISLNMCMGFIPMVDNSAHVGGFLAGFFLGFVLLVRPQFGYVSRKHIPTSYSGKLKPRHKWYQYVLGIAAIIILALGYTYGFGKLYGVPAIKRLPG